MRLNENIVFVIVSVEVLISAALKFEALMHTLRSRHER